jgi:hypothetical protein
LVTATFKALKFAFKFSLVANSKEFVEEIYDMYERLFTGEKERERDVPLNIDVRFPKRETNIGVDSCHACVAI